MILSIQLFQNQNLLQPHTVPPTIVPFTFGEKPAHIDQYLSIQCTISDGDLPLTAIWTFNGQPITADDSNVMIMKMGKRSSVLTIESVHASHAGKYDCQVENHAGTAVYSTELKIIGVLLCIFFFLYFYFFFVYSFFFLFCSVSYSSTFIINFQCELHKLY